MTQNINSSLSCIELNPSIPPTSSIIWLHGLGADGNDFVPIVSALNLPENLPLRFVFPSAPIRPVTINNGYEMRAWYDIKGISIEERADAGGIAESVKSIKKLIENEIQAGIPSERIILAGFSQGALIALLTGLSYSRRLAGILFLSGYLPNPEHYMTTISPANRSIPIFIAHGTEDTVVPYAFGLAVNEVLTKHSYSTSLHSYPMQHSVCVEEIHDIAKWLYRISQNCN